VLVSSLLKATGLRKILTISKAGEYVKEWRAKRKEGQKEVDKKREKMIQDEMPSSKHLYKLVFLVPGGIAVDMIQNEIIFKRHNRRTFVHYG